MAHLTDEDAQEISSKLDAATSLRGGPVIALSVEGNRSYAAFARLREHLASGAAGPNERVPQGAVVGAIAAEFDAGLLDAFFGNSSARLASSRDVLGRFEQTTCVLVLPSALSKGLAGNILEDLLARVCGPDAEGRHGSGLALTAVGVYDMERRAAEDFMEVYRHVVPEYSDLVRELNSGPLLALELAGEDAVARVREVVGPRDVELARKVRPHTIRAKYGFSSGSPAVHCTDLVEDGPLENEFMFSILEQA
jgi:nucleoside-diphosphate kinase